MAIPDHECRFNRPGACLERTAKFEGEDERFKGTDPLAWEHMHALMLDACEDGLPLSDNAESGRAGSAGSYRAPIGRRAFKRSRRGGHVPWVGELRVESASSADGGRGLWRAYFHDLIDSDDGRKTDHVLMSSVREKGVRKSIRVTFGADGLNEQDRHIVDAIDSARRWVNSKPLYELRLLQDQRL